MTQPLDSVPLRVILPFIIVTLIWGSTWLVIRDQLGVVPTEWSICYRFSSGGLAMLAYAAATRARLLLRWPQLGFAALVGFFLFFINFAFVYRAEAHVASGVVAMFFALLIVPNTLLARLFLGLRVTPLFLIGSAVSLAGMALLFSHELAEASVGGNRTALGVGYTLLGVSAASVANVMQASRRGLAQPPVAGLAWAMLIGAALHAVFALVTAGPPTIDPRPAYIAGVLYLGVIGSAVSFPLYFFVIRHIGPGRAAYSGILVPIIAMALSTMFEDYRWSLSAAAGGLLALAGLAIALRARNPAR